MKISTLFILAVFFFACSKSTMPGTKAKNIEKGKCEKITNNAFPLICFDSVVYNGRCPANAQCIWAGYATVKLYFKTARKSTSFLLSTINYPGAAATDTIVDGYNIKLESLDEKGEQVKLVIRY